MLIGRLYNKAERTIADLAVCILIALCLCLPAQSQIIKIPFLGLACVIGLIKLYQSRGQVISKSTWIWFGAYLLYNIVWSVLGFINGHMGASDYFRLGVIWPIAFFLVTACIGSNTMKWITRVMMLVVVVQVVSVFILIGYAFQLWPNVLEKIYQDSAVGIHPGYIHVVSHFIGGMAFSVPFVYSFFVLNHKIRPVWQGLFVLGWFLTVVALVATSRRILLIVLLVCVAAVAVVPFLYRKERKRLLIRSVSGLVITCLFVLIATSLVVSVSTHFLSRNYDALLKVIQNNPTAQDSIKYTDRLVFDLEGILPPQQDPTTGETEPGETDGSTDPSGTTEPDGSSASTEPSDPDNNQVGDDGFKNRVNGLLSELDDGTVRGRILASVLGNWAESPIVGVGFGAQLPGYPGREDGVYEMEYVVRLYTTGLLGLAILFALMAYAGIAPLRHIRQSGKCMEYIAPCTVAYLGAVVATLSNPYIFSGFDYLFMLFLPIAFLNCVRTDEETTRKES